MTGIVLAGGRSLRFGGDKLAIAIEGRPLLHHAIGGVAAVASEILVVVAPGAEPALPADLAVPIRLVHDPEAFGGPLIGLGAALAAAHPLAVVVGGDMPRLVPAVLVRLLRRSSPSLQAWPGAGRHHRGDAVGSSHGLRLLTSSSPVTRPVASSSAAADPFGRCSMTSALRSCPPPSGERSTPGGPPSPISTARGPGSPARRGWPARHRFLARVFRLAHRPGGRSAEEGRVPG